jgi:prepilin-type N-terminal cleavage/methylation domain-containing protein
MRKGVTLLELVIAIGIVGMLSLGLAFMITQGLEVWTGGTKRTDIVDKGRMAMERFSRELRQAERFTVDTWTANNIKFNVVLYYTTYIVEYKFANNALQRSEKTSATAADDFVNLAQSVNNLTFTYYNRIGGSPAAANDIRTVRVSLVMDMPSPEQDVTLETEVQLRNFFTTGN